MTEFIDLTHEELVAIDVKNGQRVTVGNHKGNVFLITVVGKPPLGRVVIVSAVVEGFAACARGDIKNAVGPCIRSAVECAVDGIFDIPGIKRRAILALRAAMQLECVFRAVRVA